MNLKPLSNRVLVELVESDEKTTKSGIVLPDTVERKEQTKGMVIAVGPGKLGEDGKRVPVSVGVGEKVLFNKPWSEDKKIEEGKKKFFLVDEDDILAIIEDKFGAKETPKYFQGLPKDKPKNPAL